LFLFSQHTFLFFSATTSGIARHAAAAGDEVRNSSMSPAAAAAVAGAVAVAVADTADATADVDVGIDEGTPSMSPATDDAVDVEAVAETAAFETCGDVVVDDDDTKSNTPRSAANATTIRRGHQSDGDTATAAPARLLGAAVAFAPLTLTIASDVGF
jgi:hypothetical protein